MVEFVGFRQDACVVPATHHDLDILNGVRAGQRLRVVITFDRSKVHHRWYWALISTVADGLGITPKLLHAQLKYEAGLIDAVLTSRVLGTAVLLTSTAFKAMDETAFSAYREIAVELLFSKYLPGVRRKDVYRRVRDLVGEDCPW